MVLVLGRSRQPDNRVSDPHRGRQAQCRSLRLAGGL